jgi:beta-glucanase (GH16 family)
MEQRLTHGGHGRVLRREDYITSKALRPHGIRPVPVSLTQVSLPLLSSRTRQDVRASACLPKLHRIGGAGGTRVLAGLLAVFAVACAPAGTVWGSPVAETDPATLAEHQRCDESQAGRPVDLSGAVLTFADEFDRPSITGPNGEGPWFAPIHGGFGKAEFLPPHPSEGPFFFDDGVLTIRLAKLDGRWTSGIVQSVNAEGEGFTQRYGYFEMRAKFPKGNGIWPAFWLKTVNQFTDQSQTRAEIDIIEAYGANDWSGYHATVHLWPARRPSPGQLREHWYQGCYERVEGDMFDGDWHLYGAEVGPEWVTIYYQRREVGRFPTLVEFRRPLFILADLALHGEEPRTTDEPADMQVDYIRVWQRREWVRDE